MVTQFAMDLFKDPFFIGWDSHLQKIAGAGTSFPPYNLVKWEDNSYTLTLAIAGFKREDLTVTVEGNTLVIEGSADDEMEGFEHFEYVHKGIAMRKFRRTFSLGEYMEVDDVSLKDGMLSLSILTHVPDFKKPISLKIK